MIIDKALYEEQGLKIPVFREYKEAEGFQIFSSHIKAERFRGETRRFIRYCKWGKTYW